MATKAEVFDMFKDYKQKVETLHQRPVRRLRTDNGGEYTSTAMENFLRKHGIKHASRLWMSSLV